MFVVKKDGSTRDNSDIRRLNSATVTDTCPMEDVRATLDWVGSKIVFSTIELKDGFFQIELEEGYTNLTAVRTVLGLRRYARMPQGLKNSPAAFQRIINAIFGDREGRDVWDFLYDAGLGTESAATHLQSLKSVKQRFLDAGARLKF